MWESLKVQCYQLQAFNKIHSVYWCVSSLFLLPIKTKKIEQFHHIISSAILPYLGAGNSPTRQKIFSCKVFSLHKTYFSRPLFTSSKKFWETAPCLSCLSCSNSFLEEKSCVFRWWTFAKNWISSLQGPAQSLHFRVAEVACSQLSSVFMFYLLHHLLVRRRCRDWIS